MFDLDKYLADMIMNCRSAFGERLLYVGLQGSWLRGEAHENSDIDVMVIISGFTAQKKLVTVHSVMNKATGALLFLLPLTIPAVGLKTSAVVVCAVATFAAIQEGYFIRTGRE